MNLWAIILVVLAACGLVWAYPKLPPPGGLILVIVVAVVCLVVLLNFAGVSF